MRLLIDWIKNSIIVLTLMVLVLVLFAAPIVVLAMLGAPDPIPPLGGAVIGFSLFIGFIMAVEKR